MTMKMEELPDYLWCKFESWFDANPITRDLIIILLILFVLFYELLK